MLYKSALVLAALLAISPITEARSKRKAPKNPFETLALTINFKLTHPIKVKNLSGKNKQVIAFGEDQNKKRILAVYKLNEAQDSIELLQQIEIPKHYLAFAFSQSAKNENLLFQTNQSVIQYNVEKNQFDHLIDSQSIYLNQSADFLAERSFTNDVNGDKLDDLVISNFNGLDIFIQQANGEYQSQKLQIKPNIQMNQTAVTYSDTEYFLADFNLDNKQDLAIAKENAIEYFIQSDTGLFNQTPQLLNLPFNTSARNWWEIRESDGEQMSQTSLSHRKIDRIEDFDNDGLADLMVRYSQSEGVLDRANDYEIYFATNKNNRLSFSESPQNTIVADGTIGQISTVDIDNDKRKEILVSSFDIGVSQIIGALLSGSIDQDVYLFKMDENNRYSEDPDVEKEVELTFSLSSGRSGEPVVLLLDVNGDNRKDLLFSSGESRLKLYYGTSKKRTFVKRPARIKVPVPKQGKYVKSADINNDGKSDLIINYGRQDDEELTNQVKVLISK